MEDYENANMYFEEVFALAEKHNNAAIIAMYMENYAFVLYKQGKVDEAIETIIQYLPEAKRIGDYQTFAQAIVALSDILIENNLTRQTLTLKKD